MIDEIKDTIKKHKNKEIKVVLKENRNKNETYYGVITECYSHVFMVKSTRDCRSFSYSDILSRDILVTFL